MEKIVSEERPFGRVVQGAATLPELHDFYRKPSGKAPDIHAGDEPPFL